MTHPPGPAPGPVFEQAGCPAPAWALSHAAAWITSLLRSQAPVHPGDAILAGFQGGRHGNFIFRRGLRFSCMHRGRDSRTPDRLGPRVPPSSPTPSLAYDPPATVAFPLLVTTKLFVGLGVGSSAEPDSNPIPPNTAGPGWLDLSSPSYGVHCAPSPSATRWLGPSSSFSLLQHPPRPILALALPGPLADRSTTHMLPHLRPR